MSFGKSNEPRRRHRPKKVEEVDEDAVREAREKKLNSPLIGTAITVVGSFLMLGIVVMGAPYTYGSQMVWYNQDHFREADKLDTATKKERMEADPKILIDFTEIITPADLAPSEAMKKVARACRQGRPEDLRFMKPKHSYKGLIKARKFLTCAMAMERQRFCFAEERKLLVDQLMAYKERRQNVMGLERYWTKMNERHEQFRDAQREKGELVPPPMDIPKFDIEDDIDPNLLAQLENLVVNGYIGPADFGYMGFYVPGEYREAITAGAQRYAPCTTKT